VEISKKEYLQKFQKNQIGHKIAEVSTAVRTLLRMSKTLDISIKDKVNLIGLL